MSVPNEECDKEKNEQLDLNVCHENALQIALQTMKERCQQLQQRLSIVEEENVQLKLQLHRCNPNAPSDLNNNDIETLKEKIIQLTKQKSQLTQNVFMIATENRNLWTRLSKLGQVNSVLGNELSKVNDVLAQHNAEVNTSNVKDLHRSKTFTKVSSVRITPKSDVYFTEELSLEDISLKLLKDMQQEKSELEKQCLQMAEIQNEIFSLGDLTYIDGNAQCKSNSDMNEHMECLNIFKNTLTAQNHVLSKVYNRLANSKLGNKICETAKVARIDAQNINALEINQDPEFGGVCPICRNSFVDMEFRRYVQHVEEHFLLDEYQHLDSSIPPI